MEALRAERGEDYPIRGSLVKQAIKRQNPGFNERAHGFRAFNELLLEAQKRGLLKLELAGSCCFGQGLREIWCGGAQSRILRHELDAELFRDGQEPGIVGGDSVPKGHLESVLM